MLASKACYLHILSNVGAATGNLTLCRRFGANVGSMLSPHPSCALIVLNVCAFIPITIKRNIGASHRGF